VADHPVGRLAAGTAGRIIEILRHGPTTVDDLSAQLGVTRTAVRAQITSLITRGWVEPRGNRKGPSKPARLFAVTAEAERQLSRAYVPVLVQLLSNLSVRMSPEDFEQLMADVGSGLGARFPARGDFEQRVEEANRLLRDLGGLTTVTHEEGRATILGQGCPLAAATAEFPQACAIIANLLAEMTGHPVTTRCTDYGRTRCCFEVSRGAA
jgi:predicted ArsR family transcriptional regulator